MRPLFSGPQQEVDGIAALPPAWADRRRSYRRRIAQLLRVGRRDLSVVSQRERKPAAEPGDIHGRRGLPAVFVAHRLPTLGLAHLRRADGRAGGMFRWQNAPIAESRARQVFAGPSVLGVYRLIGIEAGVQLPLYRDVTSFYQRETYRAAINLAYFFRAVLICASAWRPLCRCARNCCRSISPCSAWIE